MLGKIKLEYTCTYNIVICYNRHDIMVNQPNSSIHLNWTELDMI